MCTPGYWHSVVPPTPTCRSCGAAKENAHGPVIPMRRPEQPYTLPTINPWPWYVPDPIWVDPNVWPYGIRYTTTTGTSPDLVTESATTITIGDLADGFTSGRISLTVGGCS